MKKSDHIPRVPPPTAFSTNCTTPAEYLSRRSRWSIAENDYTEEQTREQISTMSDHEPLSLISSMNSIDLKGKLQSATSDFNEEDKSGQYTRNIPCATRHSSNLAVNGSGRDSREIHKQPVPYFYDLDHFRQIIGKDKVDRQTLKHWFKWSSKQIELEKQSTINAAGQKPYPKIKRQYQIKSPRNLTDVGKEAVKQYQDYHIEKWLTNITPSGEISWAREAPILIDQKKYVDPTLKAHKKMPHFFAVKEDVFVPPFDQFPVESVRNITNQIRILNLLKEKKYDENIKRKVLSRQIKN